MVKPDHDSIGQPANAPGQEQRILTWLLTEPGGLTQLEALQHLAIQRLAAMVYRLKGRGHVIETSLVAVPTRYGDATVARYHLVYLAPKAQQPHPPGVVVPTRYLHPRDRPQAQVEQPGLFA